MSEQQHHIKEEEDRRKYNRLNCVFPVRFTLVQLQGDLVPGMGWVSGTTKDVSKEGLCVETGAMNESLLKYLNKENFSIELQVQIEQPPIRSVGEIAWFRKEGEGGSSKYLLGIRFKSITAENLNKILKHAEGFNVMSKVAVTTAALFFLGLIAFATFNMIKANKSDSNKETAPIVVDQRKS